MVRWTETLKPSSVSDPCGAKVIALLCQCQVVTVIEFKLIYIHNLLTGTANFELPTGCSIAYTIYILSESKQNYRKYCTLAVLVQLEKYR